MLLDERQITTTNKAQSDLLTQKSILNMVSTAKNKLCLLFQYAIYLLMDAKQRIFKQRKKNGEKNPSMGVLLVHNEQLDSWRKMEHLVEIKDLVNNVKKFNKPN